MHCAGLPLPGSPLLLLPPLLLPPGSVRRVEPAHIPLERGGARCGWMSMLVVASELGRRGREWWWWWDEGRMRPNQARDAVAVGFKLRSHAQRFRSILAALSTIRKIKYVYF